MLGAPSFRGATRSFPASFRQLARRRGGKMPRWINNDFRTCLPLLCLVSRSVRVSVCTALRTLDSFDPSRDGSVESNGRHFRWAKRGPRLGVCTVDRLYLDPPAPDQEANSSKQFSRSRRLQRRYDHRLSPCGSTRDDRGIAISPLSAGLSFSQRTFRPRLAGFLSRGARLGDGANARPARSELESGVVRFRQRTS